MRYFPVRRSAEQADALMDSLKAQIDAIGYGFTALELSETEDCIGFCGLSPTDLEPIVPEGSVEIGWRLTPETWGKGYASEAAKTMLDFGFQNLALDEIVSFAVSGNHRSTAVMRRIGMHADPLRDFDHPNVPDSQPELRRHVFYCLTRSSG